MVKPNRLTETTTIKMFVKKARENGFTDSDIQWMLRELMKDYPVEARKPELHPNLMLDILKKKVESMATARRIVKELCEELGIKTEKI